MFYMHTCISLVKYKMITSNITYALISDINFTLIQTTRTSPAVFKVIFVPSNYSL